MGVRLTVRSLAPEKRRRGGGGRSSEGEPPPAAQGPGDAVAAARPARVSASPTAPAPRAAAPPAPSVAHCLHEETVESHSRVTEGR